MNTTFVIADAFEIGHTREADIRFMERAVLDLYILSKCDILFTTWLSTYGNFAKDISDSSRVHRIKYLIVCMLHYAITRNAVLQNKSYHILSINVECNSKNTIVLKRVVHIL